MQAVHVRRGIRRHRRWSGRVWFTLALAIVGLIGLVPAGRAGATVERTCRDVTIPVAMSEGAPADRTVYGRWCIPTGGARVVQLLLPGMTYDHTYWDLPDAGGRPYSYTAVANQAGTATLALDRIGIGRSSHPLGLTVTIDVNAFIAHQVIQTLRSGLAGASGYRKVVLVGHSYGSWISWYESTNWHDADAVIFSGISHSVNATAPLRLLPRLVPAALDPGLSRQASDQGWALDATYLTSQPGQRQAMFHDPGPVDPALLAFDEAHKQTVTAGEIANFPLILAHPLDVRVPVLLANGTRDPLFCGLLAVDCSTAGSLVAAERPHLGPHVPSVDGFVLPGAGHNLNYAPNAQDFFTAAQTWITRHTG